MDQKDQENQRDGLGTIRSSLELSPTARIRIKYIAMKDTKNPRGFQAKNSMSLGTEVRKSIQGLAFF